MFLCIYVGIISSQVGIITLAKSKLSGLRHYIIIIWNTASAMCAFVQDVIHNEDMKLDWEFKLSLLTDLVMVF